MKSMKSIAPDKAFILDTIRSTGKSRAQIILCLARFHHIHKDVWRDIGKLCPEISEAALDFFAIHPAKIQRLIMDKVASGNTIEQAILAITGEIFSDDAACLADLLDIWRHTSAAARSKFLDYVAREKKGDAQ